MTILIVAEHDNRQLNPATLHAVSAAIQLCDDIHVLVVGYQCQHVTEQAASIVGVDKIIVADSACYEHLLAENIGNTIAEVAGGFSQNNWQYSHIVAGATSFIKNVMPRVAALLDVGQVSDIISIDSSDTFQRPIYAGNAISTVQTFDSIKVLTIRTTAFEPATLHGTLAIIEPLNIVYDLKLTEFVSQELVISERPELTSAKVVVSGGRGMGNGSNFSLIENVADKLDAAVGASRAAVDAGFVANDMQVGQTGKIVAPELYIAVGISGAIQHLAGMKDSKVIVAINKDEDAPIFSVADYGLVADLFDVMPELAQQL